MKVHCLYNIVKHTNYIPSWPLQNLFNLKAKLSFSLSYVSSSCSFFFLIIVFNSTFVSVWIQQLYYCLSIYIKSVWFRWLLANNSEHCSIGISSLIFIFLVCLDINFVTWEKLCYKDKFENSLNLDSFGSNNGRFVSRRDAQAKSKSHWGLYEHEQDQNHQTKRLGLEFKSLCKWYHQNHQTEGPFAWA